MRVPHGRLAFETVTRPRMTVVEVVLTRAPRCRAGALTGRPHHQSSSAGSQSLRLIRPILVFEHRRLPQSANGREKPPSTRECVVIPTTEEEWR